MNSFAVIFDMDGVLVDSRAAHLQSWQQLGREIGNPVTDEEFASGFGRTSREIIREMFRINDDHEIRRLDARKEAIYREIIRPNVPAMPGADELINRLYGMKVPIAVGSSGPPENIQLILAAMDWATKFSAIVSGADVTRGKPDPQVFLLAAERLRVPASHCIVIEDAPAGIEAARRGGMRVIALAGSHPRESLLTADGVITRLELFLSQAAIPNS